MSIHNTTSISVQPNTVSRKRTRDETEGNEIDSRPFTIKPDPADPFARPRIFTPLHLVSRAQLPLAYLDTSAAGSRLFCAHVHVLESCYECGEDAAVLVAKDEKEKRLYAIERVKHRTYALCRLGSWVKHEQVKERAKLQLHTEEPQRKRTAIPPIQGGGAEPWWKTATVEITDDPNDLNLAVAKLPQLAMQRVMDAPQKSAEANVLEPDVTRLQVEGHVEPRYTESDNEMAPAAPQDVLHELAKQYMEALYISRTSLAYFTKGPLSRARAACSSEAFDLNELVDFLRTSVLSSNVMDKKHRDKIPEIAKELPVQTLVSPEQSAKRKKKRRWKAKRDKNGFFVAEEEYVERWWRMEDDDETGPSSAEKVDATVRRRMPRIRSRETFLQIVLLLEVLALEASLESRTEDRSTELDPAVPPEGLDTQKDVQQAADGQNKAKAGKKQDLPALLEAMLDKLCIWHSLEANSPAKKQTDVSNSASEETTDELKGFCIDVIVPFYNSRIPRYAAIVNKKLGGPSAPTPVKRKSSTRRPGEPAVRQPPGKKPRGSLTRVSTGTFTSTRKHPPSLHRSATDTDAAIFIKREASQTPSLDTIPPTIIPAAVPRKRESLLYQISSSKREVDLSAISQASEAKLRKKAEVEAKLKEAISTLKKPNRALAVKEIEERTDESFAKAVGGAKARRKPVAVHVAATLAKHEGRSLLRGTPRALANPTDKTRQETSSGTIQVPSSSARMAAQPSDATKDTFAIPYTGHRSRFGGANMNLEDTPSRGFAKFMPPGLVHEPGTLESPIASRKSSHALQQTPSKPIRSFSLSTVQGTVEVGATPVKQTTSRQPLADLTMPSPNVTQLQNGKTVGYIGTGRSIYDTLGWNEEYEELT